ncbi:alpha/beta fold hydrolase [Halospeciosus flavus]|uniref:Alpha/beta fold hydrolase n=1 Tax=Halospeciosus flavus TaxID=3032283 RepID=A0ABD5Z6L0_9EURY|nr:alpha/beta hydrolase [Halospeciosus flavus]
MENHTVTGGGGVDIRVDATGPEDARPILFVHGYSQSRLSWVKQFDGALADDYRLVAPDVRGHGESGKPRDAYDDAASWADDLQAVVDELGLDDPVFVGWSYGGLVISDYLSVHGTDDVAGVNFVGAISEKGTEDAARIAGEEFVALGDPLASRDATESVAALSDFLDICVAGELDPREKSFMLGFNVATPPHVREALQARTVVHEETLAALDVPVLLTHGEEDQVVGTAAAEKHADLVPDAETSFYEGVGHSPFWEAPERFERELRAFVESL